MNYNMVWSVIGFLNFNFWPKKHLTCTKIQNHLHLKGATILTCTINNYKHYLKTILTLKKSFENIFYDVFWDSKKYTP
jgi:hypothetical protein